MPFKPGQSGNPSGARAKPFADALRMELAAAGADSKALRKIAQQLITLAESGDLPAIKELADRTDGKVPQAHIGGDETDPAIMVGIIERRSVKAPARN